MTDTNTTRQTVREQTFERDESTCVVPWCDNPSVDAHHIIERALWDDGGYMLGNLASVCSHHHKAAERNEIPPQAFWQWLGIATPLLPESVETPDTDKWGESFETPPWSDLREYPKYPSSRHLLPLYWHDETLAEERIENDDTGLESIAPFVGVPLVITHKMDGGNCLVVNDVDNPVRARNGTTPEETMKPLYKPGGLYWQAEVSETLPDRLEVFGEWLYAKHSIHYGCDCDEPCDDVGPALSDLVGVEDERAYFQIFGVFDTGLNLWLSWPETERVADALGFPTTPVIYCEDDSDAATFESEHEAINTLTEYAHDVVANGGEGIVVRRKYPFHYGQFGQSLGKYVRENHVTSNEHWSHRPTVTNVI